MHGTSRCFAERVRGIDPFSHVDPAAIERFISAASTILRKMVFERLVSGYAFMRFHNINELVVEAQDAAAIALGKPALFRYTRHILDDDDCYADDALRYLAQPRISPVERITFIELIVQAAERRFGPSIGAVIERIAGLLSDQAIPLTFKDGRFDPTDGPMIEQEVHDPFWDLVRGPQWDNVRTDMQTAISLRDNGGPNPALYAARALESTVKVISSDKGWLTGRERGAANVIDTLVSSKNGRFIEPWEAEILKRFFADVRNPDAHGAGSAPQPKLSNVQTNWAIEFCMISIKSLVARL